MTWEQMMEAAEEMLADMDTAPEHLPAPLAYVFETAAGTCCTVRNDDFQDILNGLARSEDTVVVKMVACWKGGWPDVPSYGFRKALLALDPKNRETAVLVRTENGDIARTLELLMPGL